MPGRLIYTFAAPTSQYRESDTLILLAGTVQSPESLIKTSCSELPLVCHYSPRPGGSTAQTLCALPFTGTSAVLLGAVGSLPSPRPPSFRIGAGVQRNRSPWIEVGDAARRGNCTWPRVVVLWLARRQVRPPCPMR